MAPTCRRQSQDTLLFYMIISPSSWFKCVFRQGYLLKVVEGLHTEKISLNGGLRQEKWWYIRTIRGCKEFEMETTSL